MSEDLSLDNLTAEQQLFADALEASGVPVTEADIKTELQQLADDAHLEIANDNQYSAFWCFCVSAIIDPARWLIAFLIKTVVPNLYVKTASGTMLDILAWAYDIERKAATKARGNLTFTRTNTAQQLLIPAGTRVRTIPINGHTYKMLTLEAAVMEVGQAEISVLSEAENAGTAYNLGATYYSIMDSDVPGITEVTNAADWLTVPGADEESDAELRLRIRNQFSAVSDWHTDAKYKAMIAEKTGFSIDRIYFDHNIPRGPGSADAYILFDAGTVPTEYLNTINDFIAAGNHGHGDDLEVKALPETQHDVSVEVTFKATVATAEKAGLLSEIEQFIRCAFRENTDYAEFVTQTAPFATFSFSKLSYDLHGYFPEIEALAWGQGDIVSDFDVPRLNTLSVTEAE
ncbi:MAG: baseplate J/gp47 family protein [Victivallaceae bacterium]|nr:baseplate J/gp47 family protein [Victivallaceae bacterium]